MIATFEVKQGGGGQVSYNAIVQHKGISYTVSRGHVTMQSAQEEAKIVMHTAERKLVQYLQGRQT